MFELTGSPTDCSPLSKSRGAPQGCSTPGVTQKEEQSPLVGGAFLKAFFQVTENDYNILGTSYSPELLFLAPLFLSDKTVHRSN